MLDSGVFVEGRAILGITTPAVAEEVKVPLNIKIVKPKDEFIKKVEEKAKETGDFDVLSKADIEVIALALEKKAKIVTNDFAVQNVAKQLGIDFLPLGKKIKKKINWVWYCPACKREYSKKGKCEFCGTELKRRPKAQEEIQEDQD